MDSDLVAALSESAQQVLTDFCTSVRRHRLLDEAADFDRELWDTIAGLGWLSATLPAESGGMGAGIAELACLQRALGQALASVPFLSTSLLARAIALWPHSGIPEVVFPAIGAGAIIGGVFCDPEAAFGITATGDANGDFRLDGTCTAVLGGHLAQLVLLPVRDPEGATGLVLVNSDAAGFEASALPMADTTQAVASIRCTDTPVPRDRLVAGAAALPLFSRLFEDAALLVAQDALGGSEAALATTVEYLKVRVQFGKPIGSFQALKHRCADHKVALEAARHLLDHAVEQVAGGETSPLPALAKFQSCDTYARIAADCVQLHGGIGYTWEHDAHIYLKRALLDQFLFGRSAWQQDRAIEQTLGTGELA